MLWFSRQDAQNRIEDYINHWEYRDCKNALGVAKKIILVEEETYTIHENYEKHMIVTLGEFLSRIPYLPGRRKAKLILKGEENNENKKNYQR